MTFPIYNLCRLNVNTVARNVSEKPATLEMEPEQYISICATRMSSLEFGGQRSKIKVSVTY